MTLSWEADFEQALRRGDVLGASDVLRKTGHEGWVKRDERERARRVVDHVAPSALVRRDWASRLMAHPRRVDKELAATILAPLARTHPRDVERAVGRLAQDDDRAVRAAAARLARVLLEDAYGELGAARLDQVVIDHLRVLASDVDPIVRQVARSSVASIVERRSDLAHAFGGTADAVPRR